MVNKKAQAVIGAGYGDEGKGLMTDFHAARGASMVVRTNGGAQAGHTVTTDDGKRHVFHHFGSGALAGAPTHLSRFFIVNPIVFDKERQELESLSAEVRVSLSPKALVTTPYDMMLNQAVEMKRGQARHGSCGLGIGETEERSGQSRFRLDVARLISLTRDDLRNEMLNIRENWVPWRFRALGIENLPDGMSTVFSSGELIERFLDDCEQFLANVQLLDDENLPDNVLFEGAQGLLLDQDYGAFPHVTRSNTGLKNMVSVAHSAGIGSIDVTYATRAYITRHGAGPLAHEGEDMSWLHMIDETNAPNEWQGNIRTAPLDVDVLREAISHDLTLCGDVKITPDLSVSCLDQIETSGVFYKNGCAKRISADDIPQFISAATGHHVAFGSFGPTRKSIQDI